MENKLARVAVITVFVLSVFIYYSAADQVPPHFLVQPEELKVFISDDKVVIRCEAGGTPDVEYKWQKNGKDFLLDRENIKADPDGKGTFTIDPVTILDDGYYQCFASNQYGTAVSQMSYLKRAVFAQFPPEPTKEYTVTEGEPLMVECKKLKSYPPSQYQWVVVSSPGDPNPVMITTGERIQLDSQGNLHFANVEAADEKGGNLYECSVFNPFQQLTTRGSPSRIIVNQGTPAQTQPAEEFTPSATETALVGKDVRLKCLFSGYPTPTVTWSLTGGSLPNNHSEMIEHDTVLVIKDVQYGDEGEYKCTGSNENGDKDFTVQLEVQVAPVFESMKHQPNNMNKTVGESAIFVCDTAAEPEATVQWMKNGMPIDVNSNSSKMNVSSDGKILTIGNLCMECDDGSSDIMVIQCNASNEHGYAYGQGYLNIVMEPEPYYEWRLIFVIVLGCVALIAAIIYLVVCIYYRRHRQGTHKGGYNLTDTKDGYHSEIPVQQTVHD